MTAEEENKLLVLASAYKEQVYEKLLEFLPKRLERVPLEDLRDLPLAKVLGPMYMQGVGEALDSFSMEELLRALREEDPEGLKA